MHRRRFVLGAGSLAGVGGVVGMGAFESTRARRDVTVDVAHDASAYLGLEKTSGYAVYDDEGRLRIDFTGADTAGEGFNLQGVTYVEDVFAVRNRGTKDAVRVDFDPTVVLDVDVDADVDTGFLGLTGTFIVVVNAVLFVFVPTAAQVIDSGERVTYGVFVVHAAAGATGAWSGPTLEDLEPVDDPAAPQEFGFDLLITATTDDPGAPAVSPPAGPDIAGALEAIDWADAADLAALIDDQHYAA